MLVIDEASQVAPDDALGAVARAKQLIVVGDHKQLPPTNFFKMVNAGGDDGNEEDEEITNVDRPSDYESILTLARSRGMAERMLAWHYRSKHPSLIALSNDQCYAGKLLPPPKPIRSDGRLWFDAFKPKDERLFVKNLEAIPGDERDVVFISVGLTRPKGRPYVATAVQATGGLTPRGYGLEGSPPDDPLWQSGDARAEVNVNSSRHAARVAPEILHRTEGAASRPTRVRRTHVRCGWKPTLSNSRIGPRGLRCLRRDE